MHQPQSGRESHLHSNQEYFEGVGPRQQEMRVGDGNRYAHGSSIASPSPKHSNEAYAEVLYQQNPSSCLPLPQGFMPTFPQPNHNSFDNLGNVIQSRSLNEVVCDHNENHPYIRNSKYSYTAGVSNSHIQPSFELITDNITSMAPQKMYHNMQNLHHPPPLTGNYIESSHESHWHRHSSTMLPFPPDESYQTAQNYGFQNVSNVANSQILTGTTSRSKGIRHSELLPKFVLDEPSMEKSSTSRKYEYDQNTTATSNKSDFYHFNDTQNEVSCIIINTDNINNKGVAKGKDKEVKNDKSPVPQNLRGDPFRSAKVKTELCRHYGTKRGCPFGDKCNYAHGEHELKYTNLMDLDRAGLIDIEIYRTHPCFTWVATGACPFDSRCSGLHDPRIRGSSKSWLPHGETLMNRIGGSISNIDNLYHQRLSELYSHSPIYEYVPLTKQTSPKLETNLDWRHFYSYICNVNRPIHLHLSQANNHGDVLPSLLEPIEPIYDTNQIFHLMIVLDMRKNKLGQSFTYMPTHILKGELCMIIQSRTYEIIEVNNTSSSLWQLNVHTTDESKTSQQNKKSSTQTIHACEVAFGPVYDPSTRAVSIWFDIPPHELTPCTPKEAKNHKRSRHRLKKCTKLRMTRSRDTKNRAKDETKALESLAYPIVQESQPISFIHHQPLDKYAFDLVTDVLKHRLSVLKLYCRKSSHFTQDEINDLKLNHEKLKRYYERLHQFWLQWSWPVNFMEEDINDSTDVIPIDIEYRFAKNDAEKFKSNALYRPDVKTASNPLMNFRSKRVVQYLWDSFLVTMSGELQSGNVPDKYEIESPYISVAKASRLDIFRNLSWGIGLNRDTDLSKLNQFCQNNDENKISILSLYKEWEKIEQDTLKKTHGSRLSNIGET